MNLFSKILNGLRNQHPEGRSPARRGKVKRGAKRQSDPKPTGSRRAGRKQERTKSGNAIQGPEARVKEARKVLRKVKKFEAAGQRGKARQCVSSYEKTCAEAHYAPDWVTLAQIKQITHRFTQVLDIESDVLAGKIEVSDAERLEISLLAVDACVSLSLYGEALAKLDNLDAEGDMAAKLDARRTRILVRLGEFESAVELASDRYFAGDKNAFGMLTKIIKSTKDVAHLDEIHNTAKMRHHTFDRTEQVVLQATRLLIEDRDFSEVSGFLWANEADFDFETFVKLATQVAFRSGDTNAIQRLADKVCVAMDAPGFDQFEVPIRFTAHCVQTLHNATVVRPILNRLEERNVFPRPYLELQWLRTKGIIHGQDKIIADIEQFVADNPENPSARVLYWTALHELDMTEAFEASKRDFREIVPQGTACEALIEAGWKTWSADDLRFLLQYAVDHPNGKLQVRVLNSLYRVPISHDELAAIIDDLHVPASRIQRSWMIHLQMKAENVGLLKKSTLEVTRFGAFSDARAGGAALLKQALADYVSSNAAEQPQDPISAWGSEQFESLRRIEDRFEAPLLFTSESFSEATALANYIVDRIERKIPTSLLRIGDGEGHFMREDDARAAVASGDARSIQRTWWGKVGLEGDRGARIVSEFRSSVASADVLGTFPYWRLMSQIMKSHQGATNRNGIGRALRAFEHLDPTDKLVTSAHFHQDLDAWHLWPEVFSWAREISWISCHDLGAALNAEHAVKTRNGIRIPAESAHSSKFSSDVGDASAQGDDELTLLDMHEDICARIDPRPGEVWLIAAGILGKIYCDLVKSRGGIGIDIGSLADYWMGHETRIYISDPADDMILKSCLFDRDPYILTKNQRQDIIGPPGLANSTTTGRYNIGSSVPAADMPPPDRKKLLVIGHPRCASGYMSRLAMRYGLEVGHEHYGRDGISSWMFTVEDLNPPYPLRDRITPVNTTFDHTLLHVRNPADAVPSVMLENAIGRSFSFRRQHILRECGVDIATYRTAIDRAVASIVYWTEIGMRRAPDWIIPVERAEELFPDVARTIGAQAEGSDRASDVLGTNFNSSEKKHKHGAKKPVLSVSDWLGIDTGLREILEAQCRQFGYDLPWEPAAPEDPKRKNEVAGQ